MNRPLPAPYRDVALLIARVLLGVVMFAHGYQKMVINGIGRTTEGFESLSIPLAIVSASFVTMVEFAGSALLILGVLTPFVSAGNLVIMAGAAVFVHGKNGIFVADGGWELVGVIGAGFLMLAACGPGRYSVDHLINNRQRQDREDMARAQSAWPRAAAPVEAPLPYTPVYAPVARGAQAAPADLWTPPGGLSADAPLPRRSARVHAAPTDVRTAR
ncbi:DoxX family protein [Pseudonocardia abyssalis]|uniref:DoxX family protein n=1 Tax=Pseudonocardia abyssalis TaxID=2792008 RepID=A0ABS6USM6_9PSEU|nr:DoxX family protein [Pseudonocardia abyssalis]MBW0118611.1 DoxX family protein [Pseudonocardia abyssalis]MBW0135182.1 DoxX family protein [Pseudonocardia abyssalis]